MVTVERVLSQRLVGRNFTAYCTELVVEDVCLMSDGSTETTYSGQSTDRETEIEETWEYGAVCPPVDRAQEAAQ